MFGKVTDRPVKNGLKNKQKPRAAFLANQSRPKNKEKPKAVSVAAAGSCMYVEGGPVLWTL